eukprot:GHVP01034103.1.p1 GENE.GHVP01034103.1~~GHVP01034103.1.p1  ORF type:complete len:280 (+),score=37.18 GHVP01034103.1:44-883(+)
MEFKHLTDQINSACGDHYDIPLPNGIIQDELHHRNFSEPEFQGLRAWNTSYYDSIAGSSELRNTMDAIFYKLQEVWKNEGTLYERKILFNGKAPQTLEYDPVETNFYIDAINLDGRRHWTVWLCNCESENLKAVKIRAGYRCKGKHCYKFKITCMTTDDPEKDLKVCYGLWKALDFQLRGLSFVVNSLITIHPLNVFSLSWKQEKKNFNDTRQQFVDYFFPKSCEYENFHEKIMQEVEEWNVKLPPIDDAEASSKASSEAPSSLKRNEVRVIIVRQVSL